MAAAARSAGLDFIVSTDHNTSAANRAWVATKNDGLEVIAGEEVTTRHGHWLAIALPPGGWVDWRYTPRDGVFATYAKRVRADGGLVVGSSDSHASSEPVGRPQTVAYAQDLATPDLVEGRWHGDGRARRDADGSARRRCDRDGPGPRQLAVPGRIGLRTAALSAARPGSRESRCAAARAVSRWWRCPIRFGCSRSR